MTPGRGRFERRWVPDPCAVEPPRDIDPGHIATGIIEPGPLPDLTATAAAKGVSTTTIGFGEGYDEGLLRAMADAKYLYQRAYARGRGGWRRRI